MRIAILCLLWTCGSLVLAADTPTTEELAQWIKDLGDENFEKRTAAEKRLTEAGEASRAMLKAAAASDDAETRIRVTRILAALDVRPCLPFLDAMAAGDTVKLAQFYAAEVLVLKGSELLKPEWGMGNAKGNRDQDQAVPRGKLMDGYRALIEKAGKERWSQLWTNKGRSLSAEVLASDRGSLHAKAGDTVLRVALLPDQMDDSVIFVLRNDGSGRLLVVAEQTDY